MSDCFTHNHQLNNVLIFFGNLIFSLSGIKQEMTFYFIEQIQITNYQWYVTLKWIVHHILFCFSELCDNCLVDILINSQGLTAVLLEFSIIGQQAYFYPIYIPVLYD